MNVLKAIEEYQKEKNILQNRLKKFEHNNLYLQKLLYHVIKKYAGNIAEIDYRDSLIDSREIRIINIEEDVNKSITIIKIDTRGV
jgi:hypothetical protein